MAASNISASQMSVITHLGKLLAERPTSYHEIISTTFASRVADAAAVEQVFRTSPGLDETITQLKVSSNNFCRLVGEAIERARRMAEEG